MHDSAETARILFPSSYADTDKIGAPPAHQQAPAERSTAEVLYGRQDSQERPTAPRAPQPQPEPVHRAPEPPGGQDGPAAADVLFDLPDGDRFVDYGEVDLSDGENVLDGLPEEMAANLGEGEARQIGEAFVAAGVGHTLAMDLVQQGVEASRRGPLADAEVERMNGDAMKTLRARWGNQTEAKLEAARGMIRAAEAKWPGLTTYLNRTGLGSDPRLIQKLAARAERRPGRGR